MLLQRNVQSFSYLPVICIKLLKLEYQIPKFSGGFGKFIEFMEFQECLRGLEEFEGI